MIITISGLPGSGKTTVGKIIARRLGYKFYSMGNIRRKIAKERGMTISELNKLGEKEEWTDKIVDDYQKELGRKEDNFVIEGRTGFFLIPNSVKILLLVDTRAGAERIFNEIRKSGHKRNEGEFRNVIEVEKSIRERAASDRRRFKHYNIDFMDRTHYDIVIDTTGLTIKQVADKIMKMLGEKKR